MIKRISSLKPGDNVLLKFHGSKQFGNDPYEMDVKFVEFNEDKTRAVFRMDDSAGSEFEAYKFSNRWTYGSSAERLTIVDES
jgi:hypothetical protein